MNVTQFFFFFWLMASLHTLAPLGLYYCKMRMSPIIGYIYRSNAVHRRCFVRIAFLVHKASLYRVRYNIILLLCGRITHM